jgi:hypothetical protein
VIPKGNPSAGISLHQAAALEAEEEAGVVGPSARPRSAPIVIASARGNGASLMVDVDVFPLAVKASSTALEGSRPARAALVHACRSRRCGRGARPARSHPLVRPSEFKAATPRPASSSTVAQKSRISPCSPGSSACCPSKAISSSCSRRMRHRRRRRRRAGAAAQDGDPGPYPRSHRARARCRRHHPRGAATVRQTFLTPFDRSAITSLIGAMDDAIDEMQAAVGDRRSTRSRELRP